MVSLAHAQLPESCLGAASRQGFHGRGFGPARPCTSSPLRLARLEGARAGSVLWRVRGAFETAGLCLRLAPVVSGRHSSFIAFYAPRWRGRAIPFNHAREGR
jgi:hypothetical protein